MAKDVPIIETGTHIVWDSWPIDMKSNMEDHWVAKIHDYNPDTKYQWDSEFLDDVEKEGVKYYNILDIQENDVLRVKNGSMSHFFVVKEKYERRMVVEEITKHNAIIYFGGDPEHPEIKGKGLKDVDIRLTGNEEDLEKVIEALNYLMPVEEMEISFSDEMYQMEDQPKCRVYGDIEL